jgi:hypothetical protein
VPRAQRSIHRTRPGPGGSIRSTEKCTEPVTPSSGFPTDRRRSGCHSESHQPRALRTRCKPHTRCPPDTRQEAPEAACRKLRLFLFATGRLRQAALALVTSRDEKAAEPEDAAAELEARRRLQIAEASALPAPERKSSPSRERFRPPSQRAFRFRVVLLGGLRPTGAPCSAQAGDYAILDRSARQPREKFRAICEARSTQRLRRPGPEPPGAHGCVRGRAWPACTLRPWPGR